MKNAGLVLLAALLLTLVGGLASVGFTVPDPKSCVSVVMQSFKDPKAPGRDARMRKACRPARSTL